MLSPFLVVILASALPVSAQNQKKSIDWSADAEWKKDVRRDIGELENKLREYDRGGRPYRDAYIILHSLEHKYKVMREASSPEAQLVVRRKEELLRQHPELEKLEDFRLSDEIVEQDRRKEKEESIRKTAQSWSPSDGTPLRLMKLKNRVLVVYQYSLASCPLPPGLTIARDDRDQRRKFFKDGQVLSPSEIPGCKTLTFKNGFQLLPITSKSWEDYSGNFLVCTSPLIEYAAVTDDERKMMGANGFPGRMPWVNSKGEYGDFCGIVSPEGKIVFRFPFEQQIPDRLLRPLTLSEDGRHAAVIVGERVVEPEDGHFYVALPREVLEWESPNALRRTTITNPNTPFLELRRRFSRWTK